MKNPLVIFDLDGTVYRTDYVLKKAVKRAAEEMQLPVPGDRDVLESIGITSAGFGDKIGANLDDDTREKFLQRVRSHDRRMIPEMGKTYEGIEELLASLVARGFELAICSNGSASYVELVLNSCGIAKYFTYVGYRRSDLSKSSQVRQLLKKSRSNKAIMVGDRQFDLQAARDNNIPFIGAAYGYCKDEILQADFVADSPPAIKGIIMRYLLFDRIALVLKKIPKDRALIAGIDGMDTSGKTIFAGSLAGFLKKRQLRVQLIHLDDFLNESCLRRKGENPVQAYIDNAFNLELLSNKLLAPAERGESVNITLRLLNQDTDTTNRMVRFKIDAKTVVIIEGVLLYRQPLDPYFDYRILLDISFEEMIKRASTRDKEKFGAELMERYRQKYIPVQQWYFEECRPREKSDLVINNTDFEIPVVVNEKK